MSATTPPTVAAYVDTPKSDAFFAVPSTTTSQAPDDQVIAKSSLVEPTPRPLSLVLAPPGALITLDVVTTMMASLSPGADIGTQMHPAQAQHHQHTIETALSPASQTSSAYSESPTSSTVDDPQSPTAEANGGNGSDNGFWLINKIIGFSKHFQPFSPDNGASAIPGTEGNGAEGHHGPKGNVHMLKRGALNSKARWSADNITVSQTEPGQPAAPRQPVKSILKKRQPRFTDSVTTVDEEGGVGGSTADLSTASKDAVLGSVSNSTSAGDISTQSIASDTAAAGSSGPPSQNHSDNNVAANLQQQLKHHEQMQQQGPGGAILAKHRLLYGGANHSSAPNLSSMLDAPLSRAESTSSLSSSKSGSVKRLAFAEDSGTSNGRVVVHTHSKSSYNRKPDSNITFRKLTPQLKMEIREELNRFKRTEMVVHQESARNTAFH